MNVQAGMYAYTALAVLALRHGTSVYVLLWLAWLAIAAEIAGPLLYRLGIWGAR